MIRTVTSKEASRREDLLKHNYPKENSMEVDNLAIGERIMPFVFSPERGERLRIASSTCLIIGGEYSWRLLN